MTAEAMRIATKTLFEEKIVDGKWGLYPRDIPLDLEQPKYQGIETVPALTDDELEKVFKAWCAGVQFYESLGGTVKCLAVELDADICRYERITTSAWHVYKKRKSLSQISEFYFRNHHWSPWPNSYYNFESKTWENRSFDFNL